MNTALRVIEVMAALGEFDERKVPSIARTGKSHLWRPAQAISL